MRKPAALMFGVPYSTDQILAILSNITENIPTRILIIPAIVPLLYPGRDKLVNTCVFYVFGESEEDTPSIRTIFGLTDRSPTILLHILHLELMATKVFPTLTHRKFPTLHLEGVLIHSLVCSATVCIKTLCMYFPDTFQTAYCLTTRGVEDTQENTSMLAHFNRHTDFSTIIGQIERAITPLVYEGNSTVGLGKLISNQFLRDLIPVSTSCNDPPLPRLGGGHTHDYPQPPTRYHCRFSTGGSYRKSHCACVHAVLPYRSH